jgi:hypothetical protein
MAKAKAESPKKEKKDAAGIAFVGFFFLGMALGALYGRWDVAALIGLAMGFIAMLVVMLMKK